MRKVVLGVTVVFTALSCSRNEENVTEHQGEHCAHWDYENPNWAS